MEVHIPEEPYDAESVITVCKAMQDQPGFQTWYEDVNRSRLALRECEQPVEILGISQMLEDISTAIDVHINRYINRVLAADRHIDVSARSTEKSAVDAAQRAEDFDYSFLGEITRQRAGGIMPWRRAVDDSVAYGIGFLALRMKPDVQEELGTDFKDVDGLVAAASKAFSGGFTENPFMVECPAMGTVFFDPDFTNVCEIGDRVLSSLLKSYAGKNQALEYSESGFEFVSETIREYESSWDDTVKVYHLETEDFIYDVVEHGEAEKHGFPLETRPNAIGRPWYTPIFGHVNNNPDVGKRYRPLIWPLYRLVQTLNITNTLIQSGALNVSRPMYQEVADGARGLSFPELISNRSEQAPAIIFDPSTSVLEKPQEGYRWEIVPVPDMKWVLEANQNTRQEIERLGFPIDLGPESSTVGKGDSAARGSQRIEASADQLNPFLSNVAQALDDLLDLVGDAIRGLDVSVTLPVRRRAQGGSSRVRESVTIKPDDYKEQDREVRLESIPASTKFAMRESNTNALKDGLMSRTTWMRLEFDDYLQEMKQIQVDKAYAVAEEEALKTVISFIQANSGAIASQAAAEQGVSPPPLEPPSAPPSAPPLAPPAGGPAEPGTQRRERPPEGATTGVGGPVAPVPQPVNGAPGAIGEGIIS